MKQLTLTILSLLLPLILLSQQKTIVAGKIVNTANNKVSFKYSTHLGITSESLKSPNSFLENFSSNSFKFMKNLTQQAQYTNTTP